MEVTQTTVSERPLSVWVPPGFSSRLLLPDSAADAIRESELLCPSHREELSLSPGAERTQVYAFRRLFWQAPRRRLSLNRVLHVLLLQVNGGKMRRRKCLELGHLPFLQLIYFLLLL